jgi:hypothetical protein
MSVAAPKVVPIITTFTKGSGSPLTASVILPVSLPVVPANKNWLEIINKERKICATIFIINS